MGCPVKGEKELPRSEDAAAPPPPQQQQQQQQSRGGWFPFWGMPRTLDQVKHQQQQGEACGCPSNKGEGSYVAGPLNPLNNEKLYTQAPLGSQRVQLSKDRAVSSIPKGEYTPKHQPADAEKWVYPSEQQYYNAMKSKGFNPREEDVGVILSIHNAVNEQGWKEILKWEEEFGKGTPKLKRFMGRPKDLSPKARLLWLMGYSLPFDRHDWFVERPDGQEVRYVMDFYTGAPTRDKPISMHLDVRPAVDSLEAVQNRAVRAFREYFGTGGEVVAAAGAEPPKQQPQAGLSGSSS